jgi:hypothetical protein
MSSTEELRLDDPDFHLGNPFPSIENCGGRNRFYWSESSRC